MQQIAVVFHSRFGNTKSLAESIAKGVATETGVAAVSVDVTNIDDVNWDELNRSKGMIFGSPTYLGSASAKFKIFMERTSLIWADQQWRDKFAGAFTTSGNPSGDKLQTLTQLCVFAAQHGMHWINPGIKPSQKIDGFDGVLNKAGGWLGVMATSIKASEQKSFIDTDDLMTGFVFGQRFAKIVCSIPNANELSHAREMMRQKGDGK